MPATPNEREAEAQLAGIAKRLNALEEWLTDAEQRRVAWLADVQEKDREIAAVGRDVAAVRKRIAELDEELGELRAAQAKLEASRLEQARRISEHLGAAYRLGGQDFVKLLLNQESPDTADRMVRYHRAFSEARIAALASYERTLGELATTRGLLDARLTQQTAEKTGLERREKTLAAERAERQKLIAQLASEAETRAAERARLEADQARLTKLLAELERRARESVAGNFANQRGKLPWPVAGTIRHRFGQSRSDGQMKWSGTLFQAPQGAPVSAVAGGRIVFADWLRGFGLLTIIDHGGGYMTLYGHSDVLSKQVGELVEGGEVIASAGQSGGQSAPGLYFEVRYQGQAQDPHQWLRGTR